MLLDNVCPQKSCSFTALLWCHTMKSTRSREWRRCSLFLVLLAFSYPQLNKCAAVNQTREWHATPAPTSRSSAVKNLFLRWRWHTPASPQAKARPFPASCTSRHRHTRARTFISSVAELLLWDCFKPIPRKSCVPKLYLRMQGAPTVTDCREASKPSWSALEQIPRTTCHHQPFEQRQVCRHQTSAGMGTGRSSPRSSAGARRPAALHEERITHFQRRKVPVIQAAWQVGNNRNRGLMELPDGIATAKS